MAFCTIRIAWSYTSSASKKTRYTSLFFITSKSTLHTQITAICSTVDVSVNSARSALIWQISNTTLAFWIAFFAFFYFTVSIVTRQASLTMITTIQERIFWITRSASVCLSINTSKTSFITWRAALCCVISIETRRTSLT